MFEKTVCINNVSVQAFIDGGSHRSLIARSLAKRLGGIRQSEAINVKGFNGEVATSSELLTPDVVVDGQRYVGDIYVVEDQQLEPDEVLLGTDLLCGVGRFVLIGENTCTLVPSVAESAAANKIHVSDLLAEFPHCFASSLHALGTAKTTEMRIELTTTQPICQRGCRIPFAQRPNVSKMVAELLTSGVIVHSSSPYTSQLVIVKKSTGEDRLCVDYRPLNAVTVKYTFPMPIVEELLAKLAGNTYFTALDFMSGYYQVPVHPDSRKFTAFDTHEGHYEFTRMPFGLVNAPSYFQACINELVRRVPTGEAVAFMDDIVIPSTSIEQGIDRLRRFLVAVADVGLTLRLDKCVFLAERIKFLGHNVSKHGIGPGDNKVAAIRDFPEPTNAHEVRRFLGLTGFFRKFVKNYARISRPLTDLLRTTGNPAYVWGDDQQTAFESLKLVLCTEPVLCLYDAGRQHEVHTDASSTGLAGILMQREDDGKVHPVFYFSRRCTPAESVFASHELEVLAIVEAVDRFRVYLLGKRFRIVTDCAAVTTTKATTPLLPRIARWWLKLQEFDYELVHRPGAQLAYVDAMSRAPVEPEREVQAVAERILRVDISPADWVVTMQQKDEKLLRIMQVLRGTLRTDDDRQLATDYELKDHRLYRKCDGQLRWVVPGAVRWRIVKNAHDDRGHFGLQKTLDHLQAEFWFPRMRMYVKNYIEACIDCAYNKRPGGAAEGQLHVTKTVPTPFRTIHIDHLGPFPKSTKGNAYVIAVVDAFSKYVVVKAVRSTDTRAVVNMLIELTQYFGSPARIVSDRGTAYTSRSFADYCERNAIQHIKNAVRTPRANGQVERMNSMIAMFLRTSHEDARKWDVDRRKFQWTINSQVNKTIGCSPNEVVFRYKLRNDVDNKLLAALHETDDVEQPNESPTLEEIGRIADAEKNKWKVRYNSKHRVPTVYAENDLVLVENQAPSTGESRKLEPKYRGPYIIKRALDCDRYIVADLPDIQRNQRPFESVFSSEKIKHWCTLGPEADDDNIEDDNSEDENNADETVDSGIITHNSGVEGDAEE